MSRLGASGLLTVVRNAGGSSNQVLEEVLVKVPKGKNPSPTRVPLSYKRKGPWWSSQFMLVDMLYM